MKSRTWTENLRWSWKKKKEKEKQNRENQNQNQNEVIKRKQYYPQTSRSREQRGRGRDRLCEGKKEKRKKKPRTQLQTSRGMMRREKKKFQRWDRESEVERVRDIQYYREGELEWGRELCSSNIRVMIWSRPKRHFFFFIHAIFMILYYVEVSLTFQS